MLNQTTILLDPNNIFENERHLLANRIFPGSKYALNHSTNLNLATHFLCRVIHHQSQISARATADRYATIIFEITVYSSSLKSYKHRVFSTLLFGRSCYDSNSAKIELFLKSMMIVEK